MSKHSLEWPGDGVRNDLPVRILPPNKVPKAAAGHNFAATALVRRLQRMPQGVFWLSESAFPTVAPDAVGHFTKIEAFGKGRAESRCQVGFGQLMLRTGTQGELAELVAVKPTSPYLAAREFGAMNALNAHGEDAWPRSFVPLGFYRAIGQTGVSLVTKYDHSVKTLDTLLWNKEQPPTEQQVCAALSHIALALGDLHALGMTSGDAQPKNIGADRRGIRYPDLETAWEFEVSPKVVDPMRVRRIVEQDLDTCLRTLGGQYVDLLRIHFVEPYTDSAQADGSLVPGDAQFSAQEIVAIGSKPQYEIVHFSA